VNFYYPLLFNALARGEPFLDEILLAKTGVLGLSVGEDFVILACHVLTQCSASVWRMDNPTVANTGLCIASYATLCKIIRILEVKTQDHICRSASLNV